MRWAGVALAAFLALAVPAGAQSANDGGGPLADVLVANDCVMTEEAAAAALSAQGFGADDYRVQASTLRRAGHLVAAPGGGMRLVDWGVCR